MLLFLSSYTRRRLYYRSRNDGWNTRFSPLVFLLQGLASFTHYGLGFTTIRDIQTGFYDRLRMAPTSRISLVIGPVLGSLVRVILMCTLVIVLGVALGARFTGGLLGIVTLYVAAIGLAVTGAGWGLGLAYRFRDMRAAAVMQLSIFVVMFLSTAQVPLQVMSGWLHGVARINPATNVLRLARAGLVDPSSPDALSWSSVWGGIVAIVALATITLAFALRGLRKMQG
jgi:ABC-2 type transport system permease protein